MAGALMGMVPFLAASYRGVGRLIRGLTEGDPVAWTIVGVGAVVVVGVVIWKVKYGGDDE